MIKIRDLMKKTMELVNVDEVHAELQQQLKHGIPPGLTTGWSSFDEYYTIPPFGQLNIISGTPGSGKSEWIDSLAMNCIANHKWKVLFYSPENNPPSFHLQKLVEKLVDKPFGGKYNGKGQVTSEELEKAISILKAACVFGDCRLAGSDLESIVNTVILKALTDRVNMVVIDPWNKVETGVPAGMNKTDHIGRCLSRMQMVAREYNIHFFVAAHPSKQGRKKDGTFPIPSLYDVSDSAHWFNMADNGFIVHRSYDDKKGNDNINRVYIQKIKDRRYGKCGEHAFRFLPWCSGFEDAGDVVSDISRADEQMRAW